MGEQHHWSEQEVILDSVGLVLGHSGESFQK